MPTLEDLASTVARPMAPRLCSSSKVVAPTWMKPGAVSMTLSALNLPDARAAATMNGLTLEPGSNRSVTARLRYAAGTICSRSLGL